MAVEDRRAQLLDATAAIVLDEGFAGVSVERVARSADVARTVVYAQFGSLDGLLLALVQRTEQRIFAQIGSAVPVLEGDPDTLLGRSMRAVLTAAWEEPDTWRIALFAAETAPPDLRKEIAESRERIRELLHPSLAWGLQQRGSSDIDADLFTRTVVAAVEGAIRLMIDDPQTYPLERILDYVSAFFAAFRG